MLNKTNEDNQYNKVNTVSTNIIMTRVRTSP